MGVDLRSLISPSPIQLQEMGGKVLAVDAYNTIYQFLSTIRGPTGDLLTNSKGEVTSHLSGLFYRSISLLVENIKLAFVFDGQSHRLKAAEIRRRSELKKEASAQYSLAIEEGRAADALKFSKRTAVLTDAMVQESKKLLTALGIPIIQAPSEGEATAAFMTTKGMAFATCSQDYDSILFSADRLVRNLTISGRRKIPNKNAYVDVEPEIIEHEAVLKQTGLTQEQLVDVAILIGTDFNPDGFAGIGPKTALKLVKENGRLEKIDKIKGSLDAIPYREIRDIFLAPPVAEISELEFGKVDRDTVLQYLCVDKNFSADRVSAALDRLAKAQETRSQSLEKWF